MVAAGISFLPSRKAIRPSSRMDFSRGEWLFSLQAHLAVTALIKASSSFVCPLRSRFAAWIACGLQSHCARKAPKFSGKHAGCFTGHF